MNDTQPSRPPRPARAEPDTPEAPRLTPPPGWQHTSSGQLAARLAQVRAQRTAQSQISSRSARTIGRSYLSAAVARLGDPRQPVADPEPEAGA